MTTPSPDSSATSSTHGMVLGKFLPPHLGHCHLVEFAKAYADEVSVVVGTLAAEPIPGALRFAWMKQLFPDLNVIHLDKELPQTPEEHPDFWQLWEDSLKTILDKPITHVFASEDYGWKLAEVLGAEFVAVDIDRIAVDISATRIREQPFENWDYIPRCVRPWFVKQVCVFGPESTGKSTLSRYLAEQFDSIHVPEYARTWLEPRNGELEYKDMLSIAKGQLAAQQALLASANKVLFSDTDLWLSTIWSEFLFGQCDPWIIEQARQQSFDHYLLTDIDTPWIQDGIRYLPEQRKAFFDKCREVLEREGLPYTLISGDFDVRNQTAVQAVTRCLSQK